MIKRFKQTQKFRVIVGDVSFYTTARQIRDGVGALGPCNAALQKALDVLEYTKTLKVVLLQLVALQASGKD